MKDHMPNQDVLETKLPISGYCNGQSPIIVHFLSLTSSMWVNPRTNHTQVITRNGCYEPSRHGRCIAGCPTCSFLGKIYTGVGKCPNVSHHPTTGDIIPNRYGKVMFKIPQKGLLPTPDIHYLWWRIPTYTDVYLLKMGIVQFALALK